ncbi:trypsin-like peptidase domain-containing protein [Streptomyces sp. NPDC006290]|uniref:S1C family serine protease n=1 Tax=Streptomyces sp. NPDC006290 TaxID=3156745 RepID=UPI0033A3ED9D
MNEGRPTKAKWWSRPRPQDTGADTAPAHLTEPDSPHPAALAESAEAGAEPSAPEAHPARAREGDTGGDYELKRPPGVPGAGEAGASSGAGSVFPAGVRADAQGVGDGGGDFELERPAPRRPKALHDPDLYSTPPYGGPGPWAPAPPVQHPTAAQAQGPQAQGQDTQDPHAQGSYTHGSHGPGSQAEAATPAHGTHFAEGVPATGTPLAGAIPAQGGAPFDALPQVPEPSGPSNPMAPISEPPAGPAASPAPAESAVPDPWQNYDPWAAPGPLPQNGPLQQNGVAVPTAVERRKRARKALVLGAVALALVSGGVGGAVGAYLERNGGLTDIELPQAAKEAPGRAPDSVAGIAAHALPSVVTLHVRGSEEEGTGTGFVLDGEGHILTNNHVIEPAGAGGTISVTFSGGETAKAEVVGHDSGYDLAVVKVSGVHGLAPMPLGNSDSVQVGDPVVAIGAPFDLANTVTSGIISAKERPITAGGEKGDGTDVSYVDALQTDAPINPGNSGGPLLDSRARVIGINSAIRSADSGSDLGTGQAGSIGLGFAIPVNQAKRVAEELINTGRATHPVIGVTLDMNYAGDGARVGTKAAGGGPPVTTGGPGAKAGIRAGDVITEVDGGRVHSGEELIVKTRAHRPGDRLRLTVRRGGTRRTVTLVLGSADGD